MLRRPPARRHLDRVGRLTGEHARQVEFLEDQHRWRRSERRILGDLLDRHAEVREMLEAPQPSTEAELRALLALRRRVRPLLPEEAGRAFVAQRSRFTAAVLDETDELVCRLRGLRPPREAERLHGDLIAAYERFLAAMAGFYAAFDQWHSDDAVVEAWLGATAAGETIERLLDAAADATRR